MSNPSSFDPVPAATAADINRVAGRDFGEQALQVQNLLEAYDGTEPHRVRLAVLKLAAGEANQVLHFVEVASRDYRDVLWWAEYPGASKLGLVGISKLTETERLKLKQEDWRQYQEWLLR